MKVLKCNPNRSDYIAARVTRENVQEVKLWCNADGYTIESEHEIVLFRINWHNHPVTFGDYLIRDIHGHWFSMSPEEFEQSFTYKEIDA